MELILKREKGTLLRCFKAEWQTKWVPAIMIIKFAESYTKKSSAAVDVRDYGINLAISVCNSVEINCMYIQILNMMTMIKCVQLAIFTVLAKKDKEQAPLHYWLED